MCWLVLPLCSILLAGYPLDVKAGSPKIFKVLPHYVDRENRHTLSPSLYERDAYQAHLRKHPEERSALRFDILWKSGGAELAQLKLRLELRGSQTHTIQPLLLEQSVNKKHVFRSWSSLRLEGEDFKNFGEVVAWRATLWDGDQQIAEARSFLWPSNLQPNR